jgi:hypothetical protein
MLRSTSHFLLDAAEGYLSDLLDNAKLSSPLINEADQIKLEELFIKPRQLVVSSSLMTVE